MRRTAYSETAHHHDDDPNHHDHVPLATSETAAAASSSSSNNRSGNNNKKWTEQLGVYLHLMAKGKKHASNPDVAAYYKHQREVLKRLIEVHELQDQEDSEPNNNNNNNQDASSTTTVNVNHNNTTTSAGALAGTPINEGEEGGKVVPSSSSKAIEPTCSSPDDDSSSAKEVDDKDGDDDEDEEGGIPATLSFILNVCLLGIKIYAAIASGSLIVLASLLDSGLDLLSGFILVYVEHKIAAAKDDPDYPLGSHYFESVGTLIFSSFMFDFLD